MATITFYAGESTLIGIGGGSGLGFYGSTFGQAITVGQFQQTTYITNSAGTAQGPQADNVKYTHLNSGIKGSDSASTPLTGIPNTSATLNIRFEHGTAVQTQNAYIKIYERTDDNLMASGVTTMVAELIHPDASAAVIGSGDLTWRVFSGTRAASGTSLQLVNSPGANGQFAGSKTTRTTAQGAAATQHDHYLAISASPDSVGSKTLYGLYFTIEYF